MADRPAAGDDVVERNVVKGRVTTEAGDPLAGIQVGADNTLSYDSNLLTTTDADGRYRIALPPEFVTTWSMFAGMTRTFHDRIYTIDLATNDEPFATSDGAIRDFVWKLTGVEDEALQLFRGELVYFYDDYESDGIDDWSKVEVTFTPTGPMIDGSTIEPFTRSLDGGHEVADVPIGPYAVTARYLPDGGAVQDLLIKPGTSVDEVPFGSSAEGLPGGENEQTLGFVLKMP